MVADQYSFDDPRTRYPSISPPVQQQQEPGTQSRMDPVPDLGETTYRGSGRLTGRKALITGGDSGIGGAVAIALAREGANVAISYLPEEEADAAHIIEQIGDAGRKAVEYPDDLEDKAYCVALVDAAVEGLGGLDIVVSNAGKQVYVDKIEDLSDEQFEETFRTNVFAMFWIVKAAVPHLKPGSLQSSRQRRLRRTTSCPSCSTMQRRKVQSTTSRRRWRSSWPRGIRVNAVAPGPTWTALQVTQGNPPEKLPDYGKDTLLGRSGQPAEIAPAYVFLASGELSLVFGETLNVNGDTTTP